MWKSAMRESKCLIEDLNRKARCVKLNDSVEIGEHARLGCSRRHHIGNVRCEGKCSTRASSTTTVSGCPAKILQRQDAKAQGKPESYLRLLA